jgi:hypothetical protein
MTAVPFVTARQCPRPASGVQRPRVPVHVAAAHCPVRASGRARCPASDVQRGCPVSVRSRVHCVRPGGRGRPRWGGQPHTWMAGVVVVVSRINGRLVVCPDRTLAVEPTQAMLASGGGGLYLAVVVGGGWGCGQVACMVTRRGRMWMRITPLVGEPGCAARRRLRSVVVVGPRPSRLVAASLLGWTATCACGRGAAAACSERRRLDAGDALTCSVGGGGEGI